MIDEETNMRLARIANDTLEAELERRYGEEADGLYVTVLISQQQPCTCGMPACKGGITSQLVSNESDPARLLRILDGASGSLRERYPNAEAGDPHDTARRN